MMVFHTFSFAKRVKFYPTCDVIPARKLKFDMESTLVCVQEDCFLNVTFVVILTRLFL